VLRDEQLLVVEVRHARVDLIDSHQLGVGFGSRPAPTRSDLGSCDPVQTAAARAHPACSGSDRRMQVLAQPTLEVQRIVDRVVFDLWVELVDLGVAEPAGS
jgi:hypothetical protein